MAMPELALAVVYALAGALVAGVVSLVPALHVYNVAGVAVLLATRYASQSPDGMPYAFVGLAAGYSVISTIPSVLLAAPDDASVFVVLPGQKYARQGRGYEAIVLTGIGSLGGVLLAALLVAVAHPILRAIRLILQPHLHWLMWAVIAWMLLSEWPKGADRLPAGWRRWWEAWRSLSAGLVTFLLSGLLGVMLFYRNPVPLQSSFQGLLPAFVGLFAVPWVLLNILSQLELPPQHRLRTIDASPWVIAQGTLSGLAGGLFAAFLPGVTGGIGALIAGHATAQRDDRAFLVSQGASKGAYYVGALLFLCGPGLHLSRGGLAAMLSSLQGVQTYETFLAGVGAAIASGVASFIMLLPAAGLVARLVGRIHYRTVSLVTLVVIVAVVALSTGWQGLVICLAATGIGLLPTLWGSRRLNCMGLILLPLALELTGVGGSVASYLGIVP